MVFNLFFNCDQFSVNNDATKFHQPIEIHITMCGYRIVDHIFVQNILFCASSKWRRTETNGQCTKNVPSAARGILHGQREKPKTYQNRLAWLQIYQRRRIAPRHRRTWSSSIFAIQFRRWTQTTVRSKWI